MAIKKKSKPTPRSQRRNRKRAYTRMLPSTATPMLDPLDVPIVGFEQIGRALHMFDTKGRVRKRAVRWGISTGQITAEKIGLRTYRTTLRKLLAGTNERPAPVPASAQLTATSAP